MGKFQGNNKKCAFVKNKMMISLLKKQKQKPQKGKFLQINNVIGTPLIFPRRKKQKGICMWGVTEFCWSSLLAASPIQPWCEFLKIERYRN